MGPIQLDPNHSSNSFADTTLAQAQLNTRFAADVQVARVNAAKVADYETQWKRYVDARDAQPNAVMAFPTPALAEVVETAASGWPYVAMSDKYVTPQRTYKPPVKTPAISIFGALVPVTDQLAAFDAASITDRIVRPNGKVFMRIE